VRVYLDMTLVTIRDLLLISYFTLVSIAYLFFLDLGQGLSVGLYVFFIIGAVGVFFACGLHLFYLYSALVNKYFIVSFFLLAFTALIDAIFNSGSNIVNLLFFLIFGWSVYERPVKYFRYAVNFIFVLAVFWSIVSYYLGMNVWGAFPGQATTNLAQGLWWRVGLFPFQTPPFSGAFALARISHEGIKESG